MIVTDQQVLAMFLILKESCGIAGGYFCLTQKDRLALVNQIVKQQSNTLKGADSEPTYVSDEPTGSVGDPC